MRVVVDTNILVRALIQPTGSVGPVLRRLRDGAYTLLYSESLLEELVDVLNRPHLRGKYHLDEEDIKTLLALILFRGVEVEPNAQVRACRDPRDDQFLEVAAAGEADVIVSGDEDLLTLHPWRGIPIVTPARFLEILARQTEKKRQ